MRRRAECRCGTAAQDVDDLVLTVDGSSQPQSLTSDHDSQLIQVPSSAWPRSELAQLAGKQRSKLENPIRNRLVRDLKAAFGQLSLGVSVAQRERT